MKKACLVLSQLFRNTAIGLCKAMLPTLEVVFISLKCNLPWLHFKLSSFPRCNSHHPPDRPMTVGILFEPTSSRFPSFFSSQLVLQQPKNSFCHRGKKKKPWIFVSHPIQQITEDKWAHSLWTWLQKYVHQSQLSWLPATAEFINLGPNSTQVSWICS